MKPKVRFEFLGGCLDGKTVCTYSKDHDEATTCFGYFQMTKQGTVGEKFMVAPPAAMELLAEGKIKHGSEVGLSFRYYQVFERMENGGEVLVRVRSVPD